MRVSAGLPLLATLLACVRGDPRINLNDPRFKTYRRGVPGAQSRSACPGMNSLANHDFLPFDGNNVTAASFTLGCHLGLGISPEVCAIIVLDGMTNAHVPLDTSFPLEVIDKKTWRIIHDCSSSRIDPAEVPRNGPNDRDFSGRVWDVALRRIIDPTNKRITINSLGVSKADIIVDTRKPDRDPRTRYDRRAAAHSAVENARLWLTMATDDEPEVEPSYVKALFEEERLPVKEGWIPAGKDKSGRLKFSAGGVMQVLDLATKSLSPFGGRGPWARTARILQTTTHGIVATRNDIIHELRSDNHDFLNDVEALLITCGYTRRGSPEPYIQLDELRKYRAASEPENGYSPGDHIGDAGSYWEYVYSYGPSSPSGRRGYYAGADYITARRRKC
ncbi:hypothetical protein XA68_11818 [Ophiocordyceps unilateralis]|uniref:Heme haloperoxidase family profile domain-containing protein n=1 Tax=Ophiocordyceps unilateralis TaxID=268505 RepID=A0A2A9PPW5_OPHUN|nr:hypothetical protein XA68_11818 [Ophiocordyceps unilateralis]